MIRSLSGDKENWENNVNPNHMLLKNLPSLTSICLDSTSLTHFGLITAENVPKVRVMKPSFSQYEREVITVKATNAPGIEDAFV